MARKIPNDSCEDWGQDSRVVREEGYAYRFIHDGQTSRLVLLGRGECLSRRSKAKKTFHHVRIAEQLATKESESGLFDPGFVYFLQDYGEG